MLVHPLGGERSEAEKDEAGVVEGLVGGDVEVIFPPERVRGDPGGYGAEVGHEAEDALRLLVLQRDGIAVGVAIDLGCGLRAGIRGAGGWSCGGGGGAKDLRGRVGEGRSRGGLCERASRGEEQRERENGFRKVRPIRSGVTPGMSVF